MSKKNILSIYNNSFSHYFIVLYKTYDSLTVHKPITSIRKVNLIIWGNSRCTCRRILSFFEGSKVHRVPKVTSPISNRIDSPSRQFSILDWPSSYFLTIVKTPGWGVVWSVSVPRRPILQWCNFWYVSGDAFVMFLRICNIVLNCCFVLSNVLIEFNCLLRHWHSFVRNNQNCHWTSSIVIIKVVFGKKILKLSS